MGVKPFRPVNTSGQQGGSTILDRMLAAVAASIDSLLGAVLNDKLMTVAVGTGDTVVTHNLGHPVVSWEVVDRDANAVVWRSPTTNSTPRTTIILRASAAVNVKLRFT